jgi:uncharacterized glyoxalase superfamily protein PhnB
MHAEISVVGTTIIVGDVPPRMMQVQGNDITLVQSKNPDAITRWFNGMKQDGSVRMGPQFWSELYGCVTDKFGIGEH